MARPESDLVDLSNFIVIGLTCNHKERSSWIRELVGQFDRNLIILGPHHSEQSWNFRGRKIKQGHSLSPGQICCNITHQLCYELITKINKTAVILEDDVDFIPGKSKKDLESLQIPRDLDIGKLSRPLIAAEKDSEIVAEQGEIWRKQVVGTWGTEALLITPSGAEYLLNNNTPIQYVADACTKYSGMHGNNLYQLNDPIFVAGKFESII